MSCLELIVFGFLLVAVAAVGATVLVAILSIVELVRERSRDRRKGIQP